MTKTLLSLGHGYSARALAPLLLSEGWEVIGTTRDPAKLEAMRASCDTILERQKDESTLRVNILQNTMAGCREHFNPEFVLQKGFIMVTISVNLFKWLYN